MSHFLLDTNVVIWLLISDRNKIPEYIQNELTNPENKLSVSVASIWEIAIKRSLGKLAIHESWLPTLLNLSVDIIPIYTQHAAEVEKLPFVHRDPFDRLLVAQARLENCILLTADSRLNSYDVNILHFKP